jgi:hypothetical protein
MDAGSSQCEHRPKPLTKVPKLVQRGKSGTPNGSQLLPDATTMTRKQTAPTRSMSQLLSTISSIRCYEYDYPGVPSMV